jgi:hypothetical protein
MSRRLLARLAALALAIGACDRRMEPYVPPEEEPPRLERPLRVPGFETPTPSAAVAGRAPADSAGAIRGVLRLGGGPTPPDDSVLFVIARPAGGGPPLAVKRLPPGPFPLEFEIGPGDAMLAGQPFVGPLLLSARVDGDGDPLTRSPTDLAAQASAPLEPGARGVELVLQPPGS